MGAGNLSGSNPNVSSEVAELITALRQAIKASM